MTDDTFATMTFQGVARRIMALRTHPWVYGDTKQRVPMSSDGFSGREFPSTNGDELTGPTYESLRKWAIGETKPQPESLQRMITAIQNIFHKPPKLTIEMLSDQYPLSDFFKILNTDPDTMESRENTAWAEQHELCRTYKFGPRGNIDRFCQIQMPGLYRMERTPLRGRPEFSCVNGIGCDSRSLCA